MNAKGGFEALAKAPLLLITLGMVVFPLLSEINNQAFNAIDNATTNTILFGASIKLIIGAVGILLTILTLYSIMQDFQRPNYGGI